MQIKYLAILFLFILQVVNAQNFRNESAVAVVGDNDISAAQYIKRFEFVPQFFADADSITFPVKEKFLYTLIAEKLWAKKAQEMSLDTTIFVRTAVNAFEKLLVRDALYKQTVKNDSEIKKNELGEALHKYSTELKVKTIFEKSRDLIYQDYRVLQEGFPFDSLLSARNQISKSSFAEVRFGDLNKDIEDVLYELEVGEYTKPLKTPNGWNIFFLADTTPKPLNNAKDYRDALKDVKKIIDSRKTQSKFDEFYSEFFSDVKAKANGRLILALANRIENALRKRLSDLPSDTAQTTVSLKPLDALQIERKLGRDTLNADFIVFGEQSPVKVKEFLRELSFWGFDITESRMDSVVNKLNGRVKKYIQQELLAREGFERDLDKLPEVQQDLSIWRDHYLALAYRNHITYSNNSKEPLNTPPESPEQLYGIEIYKTTLSNKADAEDLFRQAVEINNLKRASENFEQSKINLKKNSTVVSSDNNLIADKAVNMQRDEISAPLKTGTEYTVFQVVGKKELKGKADLPRHNLDRDSSLNEKLNKSTNELANQYGFKIYRDHLKSLELSRINTLIYRHYGFGGKTVAVPIIRPFNSWIEQYKNQQELP